MSWKNNSEQVLVKAAPILGVFLIFMLLSFHI